MSDTANTALWDRLKKTDPKATKPFQKSGGFRGTQIDPVWRQQMMTEVFGPVGEGWGYEVEDTRIESGMVFCLVRAWYLPPGIKAEFSGGKTPSNARWTGPQWGGTEIMGKRGEKTFADDECFKKSITDGLGKCLLQLGVAADVHMGQYEDSKYKDEVAREFEKRREAAGPTDGEKALAATINLGFDKCESVDELTAFWKKNLKDINSLPDGLKQDIINHAGDRKRALTPSVAAE